MEQEEKMDKRNIVFFDGVCNLCNSSVDLIMRKNRKKDIYFSSLQSGFAKEFLAADNIGQGDLDTIIYYTGGKFYFRSTAVLKITKKLSGGYKLLQVFLIVPRFIRDGVYRWVAKNRYRFFGKRDTCRLPTAEEKALFIE